MGILKFLFKKNLKVRSTKPEITDDPNIKKEIGIKILEQLNEKVYVHSKLKAFQKVTKPAGPMIADLAKNNKGLIKVLELGAGIGNFTKFALGDLVEIIQEEQGVRINWDYLCTEKNEDSLNYISQNLYPGPHNLKFEKIDAVTDLGKFEDKEVDLAIAIQMIHHITNDDMVIQFLKDIKRISKAIFIYEGSRSRKSIFGTWIYTRISRSCKEMQHDGVLSMEKSFTLGEMKDMLKEAGLNNVEALIVPPWEMVVYGLTD